MGAAIAGKRVLASKTEPKCKLCRDPNRDRIDQLLLARSLAQSDVTSGRRINEAFVLEALAEMGVPNPTPDNLKVHFRKHCEVQDASLVDETEAVTAELFAELIESAPTDDDPVSNSRWQVRLWRASQLARLRSGEGPSVTTDQAQTAQRILVQAHSNDAQEKLLGGLAGAVGAAMQRGLGGERKALPPVVDAEVVEEAEVDA